jgi:hypothetical protein
MPEHNGGFTQEQLVVYKLGQIESQLAALIVKITESNQSIKTDLNAAEVRIKSLEDTNNKRNLERAKIAGATGAIFFLLTLFKGFAEKWLGLHFLT